jgi:hypothetical protein
LVVGKARFRNFLFWIKVLRESSHCIEDWVGYLYVPNRCIHSRLQCLCLLEEARRLFGITSVWTTQLI